MCTPRTLFISSLHGPETARFGQTQLRPWTDLSQWTDGPPSWLSFNKCSVQEYLCSKYIQTIKYSGIKKEHFLIRMKIAKGLFPLPYPTVLESRKAFTLINRDVLVFLNNVVCLNLLLCSVQKTNTSQIKKKTGQSIAERAL